MERSSQTLSIFDEVKKLKQEIQILKNVVSLQKCVFSVDDFKNNDKQFKFYTGLTWLHFRALWDFLGPSREKLRSHRSSPKSEISPRQRKLDPINELFLTLVGLRTGLRHSDLANRFGISISLVEEVLTDWIQFMNLKFSTLKKSMFATQEAVARTLPPGFRRIKGIRTIIGCAEFFAERAADFEHQGHLFSSNKIPGTFNVLIGVSPSGALMFVSEAFEGSISETEIVKQSGFLDYLEEGDLVLADQRFSIRKILREKGVDLKVLPLANGRKKLMEEDHIYTEQMERGRIHVERCIERIKKFRLLSEVTALSPQPVLSQVFFVAGCLVYFQQSLVTSTQAS